MKQQAGQGRFQFKTMFLSPQGQALCSGLVLTGLSVTLMVWLGSGLAPHWVWQILTIVGLGLAFGGAIAAVANHQQQRQQQYRLQQCLHLLTQLFTELDPTTPPPALPPSQRTSLADLYALLQQLQAQQRRYQQTQTAALDTKLQSLQGDRLQQIQSEKMISLNQMAAGLAHEINNPVNFISGNLPLAQTYIQDLLLLIVLYQQELPHPSSRVTDHIGEIDLDFVQSDLPKLLSSLRSGAQRIHSIVESLRTFARLNESQLKAVDLHAGIESTLIFLQHRLNPPESGQPVITVVRDYGDLPPIECYASQLNQVFLNLLANAIDALVAQQAKADPEYQPQIIIQTRQLNAQTVAIAIADNGGGIAKEARERLFDPFFTTKPVGKGTGLGLAISYQVIVEQHQGSLTCDSTPGEGTQFQLQIPLKQLSQQLDPP